MSDLMREEFEAWQSKETPGADLEHCGELIGNGPARVSYRNMYVAERWIGWKASRECLVIELPEPRAARGYGEQVADALGFNDGINYCEEAIHAVGVQTK